MEWLIVALAIMVFFVIPPCIIYETIVEYMEKNYYEESVPRFLINEIRYGLRSTFNY